jgi:hypothetical protein
MIVQKWAPQTYYDTLGAITGNPESMPQNLEAEQILEAIREAITIYRMSRCEFDARPYLPRVVERSGRINYFRDRSIDNISTPLSQTPITILHIP